MTKICPVVYEMMERLKEEYDFLNESQSVIKTEKKTYPNDPCPCGSGKKYKRCCGRNIGR
ncbi:MAG: SEC-C domain-containing protein [Lachnospiraceae bacterium]|nr:SEC-C domain-containing protein [Lachnospiraceae bacterium]